MTPADFGNFFAASTGAAAALVGLLFVAVSLSPEQTIKAGAPMERQAQAGSTFTALLNALFVSLGALIPGAGLGGIVIVVSVASVGSAGALGIALIKDAHGWVDLLKTTLLAVGGLVIYVFELRLGISLAHNPTDTAALNGLANLLLVAYGLGMIRAWELLGAQSFGLHRLLNRTRSAEPAQPATIHSPSDQDETGVSPSQRG